MNARKRWVVREHDGETVADVLDKARISRACVSEGRVFIGRRRVVDERERVNVGDEVLIGGERQGSRGSSPNDASCSWNVLWESECLLACNKPAGMPTVADHIGASHALVNLAAARSRRDVASLVVTSRLDREVSGVVMFATTPEAAERLRVARAEGRYIRRYVAIAAWSDAFSGLLMSEKFHVWDAPIGAGSDARHRSVRGPSSKEARTRFRVVAKASEFALLAVAPETGRTHQIRVHASFAGGPLLGDRDYKGVSRVLLTTGTVVSLSRIALHAARVTVPGTDGLALTAEAPIPPELERVWTALGGAPEAWKAALACAFETGS